MKAIKRHVLCLAAVAGALSAAGALTDITWVGAAGADYNTASNWSPAAVPSYSHRVIFNGDASVVVSSTDSGKIYAGEVCVLSGNVTLTKGATAPENTRLIVNSGTSEVVLDVASGATMTANIPVFASFDGTKPKPWTGVKKGGGKMSSLVGTFANSRTDFRPGGGRHIRGGK